jgi:hypothetical protein
MLIRDRRYRAVAGAGMIERAVKDWLGLVDESNGDGSIPPIADQHFHPFSRSRPLGAVVGLDGGAGFVIPQERLGLVEVLLAVQLQVISLRFFSTALPVVMVM